jgi:hypothetical protein
MDPRKVVIFDLDGCISDDTARAGLRQEAKAAAGAVSQELWLEYNEAAPEDPPAHVDVVRELAKRCDVAILTARPEACKFATIAWLEEHDIPWDWLLMRPENCDLTSPELKAQLQLAVLSTKLAATGRDLSCVVMACDDREDVLMAYAAAGLDKSKLLQVKATALFPVEPILSLLQDRPRQDRRTAANILDEMASTYRERNAVYGDNFRMVGQMMKVLFPEGIPKELLHSDHFHLFELKLVKLSRFAISGLSHVDSIHDDGVYSAMIEQILTEQQGGQVG